MQIDTRRKVLRFTTMALAIALLTTSALPQEQPRHPSVVTPAQAPTGEVLAEHISVSFAPLAPEWVAEQNVMDPIWEPLGYKGVNYYAYGGPATGHNFAARSDPNMQAQMETVDMVPDNPGIWMFHCHIDDHMDAGMVTLYKVGP